MTTLADKPTTAAIRFADAFGRMVRRTLRSRVGSLSAVAKDTRSALQRYCPHRPWPKQEKFLSLPDMEVMYGGAAGGGKSDVLLMAALQYVDVPGYAALILRRDMARMEQANSILDRAKQWLWNTDAKWNDNKKNFRFPSGAVIQFGYMDNPDDRFRYASAEYQFIGWDELTEFRLSADDENNPYTFMFSRLRRPEGLDVPLRFRAASNPGNIGHAWVKKRFITPEAEMALREGIDGVFDVAEGRKFIPARVHDNPAARPDEYRKTLGHLPVVTRERLMNGDWSVAESLQIPEEWLKRYSLRGQHLVAMGLTIDERQCQRFATIDTAGTSKDKAKESKGKPVSWSTLLVWDYWRSADLLFLRHVWRDRVSWGELKTRVPIILQQWQVPKALIENAHFGQPLADEIRGCTTELVGPVIAGMSDTNEGAKLDRAVASGMLIRFELGKTLLPEEADWLPAYILELTSWTGNPDETCDQIDGTSYAAWHVKRNAGTWSPPAAVGGLVRRGSI